MSPLFPSIWLEFNNELDQKIKVGGNYREWSNDGILNSEEQLTSLKILTSQMEKADGENKPIIMMGDMNICTTKWNEPDFKSKRLADEIKATIAQCGMTNIELTSYYCFIGRLGKGS